jgi:hypothetical protein
MRAGVFASHGIVKILFQVAAVQSIRATADLK